MTGLIIMTAAVGLAYAAAGISFTTMATRLTRQGRDAKPEQGAAVMCYFAAALCAIMLAVTP